MLCRAHALSPARMPPSALEGTLLGGARGYSASIACHPFFPSAELQFVLMGLCGSTPGVEPSPKCLFPEATK